MCSAGDGIANDEDSDMDGDGLLNEVDPNDDETFLDQDYWNGDEPPKRSDITGEEIRRTGCCKL